MNNISGDDIALIEREFENAIMDLNDTVRKVDVNLKKVMDNFSDLGKYWTTRGSESVIRKIEEVSSSVSTSQKNIKIYCRAILSSVGSGDMLDVGSDIAEEKYE
jgi:hypothetical protein